jgi:hypothetical protein
MARPTRFDTPGFSAAANALPLGRDPASVRKRVEAMEALLERTMVVPVINQPIGLDFLIGLVPVVGDLVTTAMGSWLVWEARNLGMTKLQIARMIGNVGVDAALGLVPVVGDAADLLFRSNSRNLRLIRRHLDKHHPATATIDA